MSLYERKVDPDKVKALEAKGLAPLMARLLALRDITPEEVDGYFAPSLADLAKPDSLPGLVEAAEKILSAVAAKKKIVVFGDYDCDGVSATVILTRTLRALGAEVEPFVPRRLSEGYGMTRESIDRLIASHPDMGLVVTVDNGINSVAETDELFARGVEVVITDHHLPGEELPRTIVVNPKVAAPPELEGLCGAGVAFFLANEIVTRAKAKGMYDGPNVGGPLLILAGLATVTDVMPARGQNRILIAEALKRFRKLAPIGLKELFDHASRSAAPSLASRDFGFVLGPRINAAGRVSEDGSEALSLLMTDDREEARRMAIDIDRLNVDRRGVEASMTDEAWAKRVPGAAAQVLDLPDGHPGVAGIVAARILEKLDPPVPVCVIAGGHGSARAPEGYNLRDALSECTGEGGELERSGGHAAAAGLSVKPGMMDQFRERFARICAAQAERMDDNLKQRAKAVDAFVKGTEMTIDLVEEIRRMEPFGEANKEPVFGVENALIDEVRPLGMDGKHLQLVLKDRTMPRAVWWYHGERVEELRAKSNHPIDLRFALEISTYGEPHVELRIVSIDILDKE